MAAATSAEPRQFVLDAGEIALRDREPLHPGVDCTVVWRGEGAVAGVLWIATGAAMPAHRHEAAEHHVWLVEGRAHVAGRTLGAGAYWHVPVGALHGVEATTDGPCVLFYVYQRPVGAAPSTHHDS